MARRILFAAAGIVAFLVFLVVLVPASQVASRLPPGIVLQGLGGTVWSGSADRLVVEGRTLGSIEWFCRPWALLSLRWSCRVDLAPPGGALSGDVAGGFSTADEIVGRAITGTVPVAALEGLAAPRGWSGTLELDVEEVRILDRRPVDAHGTLVARDLRSPGPRGQRLGDFELAIGEGAVGSGAVVGRLRDLGGPLRVRGAVEFSPDGSYLAQGEVAPGPGAGPAIFDTLAFLGPPDSLGRRPFSVEGTL